MTTTLETFREYIQEDVAQCPQAVVTKKIREVLVDFCEQTRILRQAADAIDLAVSTAEYSITFTGDYLPIEIDKAYLGDGSTDDDEITVTSRRLLDTTVWNWQNITTDSKISACLLTESGAARVYPIPSSAPEDDLYLTCFVKPTWTATEVEDRLYNDWLPVIRDGVLGELMKQKGRPWADLEMASYYANKYFKGRADAKGRALQGKADNHVLASYAGSTMY